MVCEKTWPRTTVSAFEPVVAIIAKCEEKNNFDTKKKSHLAKASADKKNLKKRSPPKFCFASVKLTYGINYVLKSPPYAEIQDQRRPPYFQYLVLYAQNQTPQRPLQWKNLAHVSISPAYLWRNCIYACARPLCWSVICSYWTSCIGQPIIRVPQVHEWQVSHVAISGFWLLIAVEVWKTNRSIVHRISSWLAII